MEYATLNTENQRNLRGERLAILEADHYRFGLMIEDANSPEEAEQARRSQADIERRIRLHRSQLGLDRVDVPEPVAEADPVEAEPAEPEVTTSGEQARAMLAHSGV